MSILKIFRDTPVIQGGGVVTIITTNNDNHGYEKTMDSLRKYGFADNKTKLRVVRLEQIIEEGVIR